MDSEHILEQIRKKESFLCVGLDSEPDRIPGHLKSSEFPLFEFNRQIIDATHDLVIAYKPNVAFYECLGASGWHQLELTIAYIRDRFPDIMVIADAKRGDIGSTSKKYAETFFRYLGCDAVTVAPYMGADSVLPFLEYKGKWVVVLALTSNQGAGDFQLLRTGNHERLFEAVLQKSASWGNAGNMMFVVGATQASMLVKVREIVPEHFLLIPGIGAQGGDLLQVAEYGFNHRCGLIVNASRSVIYAGDGERFAGASRKQALVLQRQMKEILNKKLGKLF